VKPVCQNSHNDGSHRGCHIDQQDCERRYERRGTKLRSGIRGKTDAREEVARRLHRVRKLVQSERAREHIAEIQGANDGGGRRGYAGLDEEGERERGAKEDAGPDAHCVLEPESVQQGLEHERQHHAAEPGCAPHDAVRETLALHKPLINIQDTRAVLEAAPDPEEDALRGHKLWHCRAK
jgi:hypothetical protein